MPGVLDITLLTRLRSAAEENDQRIAVPTEVNSVLEQWQGAICEGPSRSPAPCAGRRCPSPGGGQRRHGPPDQARRLGLREVGVLLDGVAPVRLRDPEEVENGFGPQEPRGDRQRRHMVGMEVGGDREFPERLSPPPSARRRPRCRSPGRRAAPLRHGPARRAAPLRTRPCGPCGRRCPGRHHASRRRRRPPGCGGAVQAWLWSPRVSIARVLVPGSTALSRSSAGADQAQFVTFDAVYHQPVGFDVRLPISLPNAPKRMVAMACGYWLLVDQRLQQHPQLAQILASRPGSSDIALELRRTNGDQHVRCRGRGTAPRRCRNRDPCHRRVPSWP